jgi:hypothetical protein
VNEATVRWFCAKFTKDPSVLLQLGLFEVISRAKNDEYRCLVCGDQIIGRLEVNQHVLHHFLEEPAVPGSLPVQEPIAATPPLTQSRYVKLPTRLGGRTPILHRRA